MEEIGRKTVKEPEHRRHLKKKNLPFLMNFPSLVAVWNRAALDLS